jgi:hypothetical protein
MRVAQRTRRMLPCETAQYVFSPNKNLKGDLLLESLPPLKS